MPENRRCRFRIIPSLVIIISITVFNLINPVGKVLFKIGSFPVTQTALLIGLRKGLILTAMVFISKFLVSRRIRFPGTTGRLINETFHYFDRITSVRLSFKPGRIIETLDNRLLECYKENDNGKSS